ncbi:Unknown protein sequence [Pseudomonas syringae pv. cilantro]|uniref:Uncharacterized protein n=1 Tax=Pseudomonas syringae pv. cilantro TaxID=81035 RepID=A0A0N0GFT8_PSESX|nr:Unknown protein sequence [Pseudomonas syringae pv. cilantro]
MFFRLHGLPRLLTIPSTAGQDIHLSGHFITTCTLHALQSPVRHV